MTYKILYDKPAVKFLRKQSQDKREWIMNAIHKLPNAGDIKPLEGHINEYRLRIGSFRVIYSIDHNVLIIRILDIVNRGDIYK